jgi:hypothetical protein
MQIIFIRFGVIMAAELLTDVEIRNAKPKDNSYTLRDGSGLFVLIHKNGSKYFQLRATVNGKPKLIQLGVYGLMTLTEARNEARKNKSHILKGMDPIVQKKRKQLLSLLLMLPLSLFI